MNSSIFIFIAFLAAFAEFKPTTTTTEEPLDLELFLGAMGDGHFANIHSKFFTTHFLIAQFHKKICCDIDMDGVEADENDIPMKKAKVEKLPGMKKIRTAPEESDIGIVPTMSVPKSEESSSDVDYFGESSSVSNPASTYLEGGDFDKITQPKCQMLGCTGPIPNDGSYAILSASIDGKACNQMFVPMNGCVDNKGYPMGMLCSICCDCANSFTNEMKKTFGYKQAIETSSFAK
ncbi:unnamed protein product [Caenorhabditis angaria]|uniref:Uncharacterized protein n=1 Tax=Caenorhabditis angaria TaxID=860376 RepID=A0A9P1N6P4_9PELO|nr:unnamed protein product [Caenorhabditis angaria]